MGGKSRRTARLVVLGILEATAFTSGGLPAHCLASDAAGDPAATLPLAASPLASGVARSIAARTDGVTEVYFALATRRRQHLARLDAYIRNRRFPANLVAEEIVPVFADGNGTRCAVAELMFHDGQSAVVAEVAQASNRVRIADLTDGPVVSWIRDSGFTQAEAAAIQPGYGHRSADFVVDTEIIRVQEHLWAVRDEVLANTDRSLAELVRPRLGEIRAKLDVASVGFAQAEAGDQARELVNKTSFPLSVRISRVSEDGHQSDEGWMTIRGGQHLTTNVAANQRLLVEWRSDAKVADSALAIASRARPDSRVIR
jgi:hypothetical protein